MWYKLLHWLRQAFKARSTGLYIYIFVLIISIISDFMSTGRVKYMLKSKNLRTDPQIPLNHQSLSSNWPHLPIFPVFYFILVFMSFNLWAMGVKHTVCNSLQGKRAGLYKQKQPRLHPHTQAFILNKTTSFRRCSDVRCFRPNLLMNCFLQLCLQVLVVKLSMLNRKSEVVGKRDCSSQSSQIHYNTVSV